MCDSTDGEPVRIEQPDPEWVDTKYYETGRYDY